MSGFQHRVQGWRFLLFCHSGTEGQGRWL